MCVFADVPYMCVCVLCRAWMMVGPRKQCRSLHSGRRQTWPTSPTASRCTTSMVRRHSHSRSVAYQHVSKERSEIIVLLPAEALNQGDTVDLDALMADLCSIEQELSTISKPNSTSRGQSKGQRAPGGRSASTKHTGTSGGGSSGGRESCAFYDVCHLHHLLNIISSCAIFIFVLYTAS